MLIDKDYYKPIKTHDTFNNNYIEYESKGSKDKTLPIKEYFDIIRPYLSDIINDHKTQGEWKVFSGNTLIYYKSQGEWKIQLTVEINFICSKDSDGTIHTKNNNIEIMIGNETDEISRELFVSLLQRYQEELEESIRESEFFLIVYIYCVTNFIK